MMKCVANTFTYGVVIKFQLVLLMGCCSHSLIDLWLSKLVLKIFLDGLLNHISWYMRFERNCTLASYGFSCFLQKKTTYWKKCLNKSLTDYKNYATSDRKSINCFLYTTGKKEMWYFGSVWKTPFRTNNMSVRRKRQTEISVRHNGSVLFPVCSWVLYSSPCEAVLETPRCLHLYRLGWVCYNVTISHLIRKTKTKLQHLCTALKPRTAPLPQSKRHTAARAGSKSHFPPNSQAYPPYPRVFQH